MSPKVWLLLRKILDFTGHDRQGNGEGSHIKTFPTLPIKKLIKKMKLEITTREATLLNRVLNDGMPTEQITRDALARLSSKLEDFIEYTREENTLPKPRRTPFKRKITA